MFANSQAMGTDTAFPDVCNTPSSSGVTPLPYSNTASGTSGTGGSTKVFFGGTPAHNLATKVSMTNGDESGASGGTTSGTSMGSSRHNTGAFTVLVSGSAATRLTSVTTQNSSNSSGSRLSPSQTKVLLLAT